MTLEDENSKAFDRLLNERESEDKININRYVYYEDMYNWQYRYTTHRQKDGKFHATIYKYKHNNGWARYTKVKERTFRKRKDAKRYCMNSCMTAKEHQKGILNARAERKQDRLDSKPQYTKEETTLMDSRNQIKHYKELIDRANTKIKRAETRRKTYEKRIRVMQKRIDKVVA